MRTKFAKRDGRRRVFACCGWKQTTPSPPRQFCRKKTKRIRNKSATREIDVGHDVSCPFSISGCATLLSHENDATDLCPFSSHCSAGLFACRGIRGQSRYGKQVSRVRWDVHGQDREPRDLRV